MSGVATIFRKTQPQKVVKAVFECRKSDDSKISGGRGSEVYYIAPLYVVGIFRGRDQNTIGDRMMSFSLSFGKGDLFLYGKENRAIFSVISITSSDFSRG